MNKRLDKILWKSNNKWQIISAAIGSFIGLFLLLASLQLFIDLQQLINGNGSGGEQYVLLNKRVNLFNTLGAKSTFTPEEIALLEEKSFVNAVGEFTPNQFKVSASSSMLGFYTELFFEAVPDEFLDESGNFWQWTKGQQELPIILSRDYLALYNFGFAPSQGLPQFTPNTIKRVTLDITISGNGLQKVFQGRIVGFSDRINSILVPKTFMDWANNNFGENKSASSSRLVLSTNNPYSTELRTFIKDNNYEVSSGRLIGGQITSLLKSLISIIAIVGSIIVLLSILIFMLNFQLIISKASEDIRLLLQLGYKEGQISKVLIRYLSYLFGGILILTIVFLFIWRYFFVAWFDEQGLILDHGLHFLVYLVAVIFAVLFLLLNFRNIRKSVGNLF